MSAVTTKQLSSLEAHITEALRSGDALRTLVLRMLRSELHNAKIAQGSELSEEEMLVIAKREVKKREEAARAYEAAGSGERAASERAELAILNEYLPAAADEALVRQHILNLKQQGAIPQGPAAIGAVMRSLKERFGATLDGQRAAALIREVLS